jgi:type IV pilus assembly protein PilW
MDRLPSSSRTAGARRQRGLTLIEFMVSIVLGMIIVAALATLVADQSVNRSEVDRQGRMIENGRYAARALADDLQMAGYWGELSSSLTPPGAWTDPCGANPAGPTQVEFEQAMALHVTAFEVPSATVRPGYNSAAPLPVTLTCLGNLRPGTDVVVVRRVDPDSSPYETGGVTDPAKLNSGNNASTLFLQTGLNAAGVFTYKLATGAGNADFVLKNNDLATMATVRKAAIRIYYVTDCSVCTGGSPDTLPSLKMRELIQGPAWSPEITIAEGVENLQLEWGLDTVTADGAPDGADAAAGSVALADWPAAVTAKIYLVARSLDTSPQYDDCPDPAAATCKKYPLGLAGTMVAAGAERNFKRHVFVQSVRIVNPSVRRAL